MTIENLQIEDPAKFEVFSKEKQRIRKYFPKKRYYQIKEMLIRIKDSRFMISNM